MEIDTRQYGKVYQITSQVMRKYYPKRMENAFYADELLKELKTLCNEAYKENKTFPVRFYAKMQNIVYHWFTDTYNGFDGLREEDIVKELQGVWKYHKKYLLTERTDDVWEKILEEGNKNRAETPKPIIWMYIRVIELFQDLDQQPKEVSTETTAE